MVCFGSSGSSLSSSLLTMHCGHGRAQASTEAAAGATASTTVASATAEANFGIPVPMPAPPPGRPPEANRVVLPPRADRAIPEADWRGPDGPIQVRRR